MDPMENGACGFQNLDYEGADSQESTFPTEQKVRTLRVMFSGQGEALLLRHTSLDHKKLKTQQKKIPVVVRWCPERACESSLDPRECKPWACVCLCVCVCVGTCGHACACVILCVCVCVFSCLRFVLCTRICQLKVTIIMISNWSRMSTFLVRDKRIAQAKCVDVSLQDMIIVTLS